MYSLLSDVIAQSLQDNTGIHKALDSRALRRRHLACVAVKYWITAMRYCRYACDGTLFDLTHITREFAKWTFIVSLTRCNFRLHDDFRISRHSKIDCLASD